MLRLRNHLLPFLRATSPLRHRSCLLLLSTSTSASAAPFSLEDYHVAAYGLAPTQARKASKQAFDEASRLARKPFEELSCSRLNSASNPDAVLALLSGVGLSRADIAAAVAADPLILRSCVKKIGPRLLAFRDRVGLSSPQIARFLLVGSRALRSCDVAPNLEFFVSFCSFEQLLMVMKRNQNALASNLDRVIKPNVALLRQCWLSVRDIAQQFSNNPRIISYNPERVKDIVLRAEELGVPRSSQTFKYAVAVVAHITKEKVAARLEFLKRTRCSESEVSSAVTKMPSILGLSEENLLSKTQFWTNEVGMEPQYIVKNPILFAFSLEKRLVPRHFVMKVLQAKGLLNSEISFLSLITKFGDETFKLKFIDCHKDSVPGLADAYAAARAGVAPSGV